VIGAATGRDVPDPQVAIRDIMVTDAEIDDVAPRDRQEERWGATSSRTRVFRLSCRACG
jgi:hypothetical protein